MAYAFDVLNLYKLYLVVDMENVHARHLYAKLGFTEEGVLRREFFVNGSYHDVTRMCIFQDEYWRQREEGAPGGASSLPHEL